MRQMLGTLIAAVMVLAVFFLIAEAGEDMAFLREVLSETETETGAETIDCFLPGQIRPMGSTTYVTRGQTIKTTKKECEARGGRPVNPKKSEAEIPGGESDKQEDHSPK